MALASCQSLIYRIPASCIITRFAPFPCAAMEEPPLSFVQAIPLAPCEELSLLLTKTYSMPNR